MSSPVDRKAFEKLRRIAPNQLAARREPGEWGARPVPEEVAFKLTNRCDLRCSHCYQWNEEDGYHHSLMRAGHGSDDGTGAAVPARGGSEGLPQAPAFNRDLPLGIVAKVLEATRALQSNVFLWGGEPLVYREWDGLMTLLATHQRWTSVCTNGTLVDRRLDSLLPISSRLEMSLSLDGFESEHDALRGAGAHARTLGGLRALLRCKRDGSYRGEISVNCVIGDAMVPRLFDFVAFLEAEGVETIYLSFPWYISDRTSAMMDGYFAEHFPERTAPAHPSWHSFKFRLDPGRLPELRAALARVDGADWRVKVRYNPALGADELHDFILGSDKPAQGKTKCLALRTRLDVFPNADVVSCKFFPEFAVGNLSDAEVSEVWHGQPYDHVRETVATCGLMPICAKCNLLYTRGA